MRTHSYVFRVRRLNINPARLPHSEISGSKRICRYPKLIAAYHVLHRLMAPRHPPCALNSLFQYILKLASYYCALAQYTKSATRVAIEMTDCWKLHLFFYLNMQLSKNKKETELNQTVGKLGMVGLTGLEPVTPRLSSVCSNQLSYRPAVRG